MNENKRRVVSLVVLALFIAVVGFANAANAGGNGGTSIEEQLLRNNVFFSPNR
ncbi:MAG: hypothetical protein WCT03_08165 [Candidatus Obscuribacterales bacterium]|jgi:hypothetical protein